MPRILHKALDSAMHIGLRICVMGKAKKAAASKDATWALEPVSIANLVPDPRNARLHPEDNLTALCASLKQFGQPEPLVVQQSTNIVISGNGRLEAMKRLGWEAAYVRFVDWGDDKAAAYSIVANRTAEKAKWDFERLADLDDLLKDKFDLQSLGFDEDFMSGVHFGAEAADIVMGPGSAAEDRPKQGKPIQLTKEQREIFDQACRIIREKHAVDYSEGRCLELFAAEYMSGA